MRNVKLESMKRRSVIAALSGALLMGFGANAMADSTDDIVNALIAKGVLTEEEGALLMKGRAGEKEAAAEKSKNAITAKVGNGSGIVFENGDKTASVAIGGRVQTDYRDFNNGASNKTTNANLAKGNSSASNEADTFDIRRARIEIKGQLYDAYSFLISENLTGSNGNASASLDQAWFNIAWWKQAQFRFGQFKAPMNLEKMTSSNFIDFQERSVVNQLAPNEERGAMIWGIPMAGTTYGLSVTTGNGQNSNNKDTRADGFEYTGRGTANFAEIMGSSDAVYHIGASASYVEIPKSGGNLLSGTNSLRTEARGVNFLTLPTFSSVTDVDNSIQRTRYGLEGVVAVGPVKFQTEWIKNQFDIDTSTTNSVNDDIDAWYAEALWLITGESYASAYKDGAFGNIKPKNDFEWGKGPGAWEVGARYSRLNAKDFKNLATAKGAVVGSVGTINLNNSTLEADTWTAGLKWILNPNSRFMIDYAYTDFDTPIQISNKFVDNEKAVTARAQWNF